MTAVVVIEALVIVLLLVLVAGLLKSHAEILRQLHRLGAADDETRWPPATGLGPVPTTEISGVDPEGKPRLVTLDHGRGHTLLAFLSSGCVSCQVFWETLAADPELPSEDTRVVIVTKGASAESPGRIAELAPAEFPVIMSDDVWDQFGVPATPFFMMIDGAGRVIGEGSAPGWRQLLRLFRRSVADAPVRLDTHGRRRFTDERLAESGIEPGDRALHGNPLDG